MSDEEALREALREDATLLHHSVHPDVSFEDCDGARCVRRRELLDPFRDLPGGREAWIGDDIEPDPQAPEVGR